MKGKVRFSFLSLVIIGSMLISGCGYKILVKKDEFKGADVATMYMDHKITTNIYMWARGGKYEKEIKDGKTTSTAIIFAFAGSAHENDIGDSAIVRIDNKNYNVKLQDRDSKTQTNITAKTGTTNTGSTSTSVSTHSYKMMQAKLLFTPQMVEAMKLATSIKYRLKLKIGNMDLVVTEKQMPMLKKFLNFDPNAQED